MNYVKELDIILEGFAVKLDKSSSGVLKPDILHIDNVKQDILTKDWTEKEREIFLKTPGMLMINMNFQQFNPRKHKWIYISLSKKDYNTIEDVKELLDNICKIVNTSTNNIFEEIEKVKNKFSRKEASDVIQANPRNIWF